MSYPVIATVSCAGPDDRDDPSEIAALAAGRPLIEIGLQLSRLREGTQNYPTRSWISRFAGEVARSRMGNMPIRSALHINGEWCRDICSGQIPVELAALLAAEDGHGPLFHRVQLNFDTVADRINYATLPGAIEAMGRPVILQSKASNTVLLGTLAKSGVPFDVLFDNSGGNGIRPAMWPMGMPGRFNAWSGGLGPLTAMEDIPAIAAVALKAGIQRFGLDAQRNLRSPCGMVFHSDAAAAFADAASEWNWIQRGSGYDPKGTRT